MKTGQVIIPGFHLFLIYEVYGYLSWEKFWNVQTSIATYMYSKNVFEIEH